jgi:hypothetical protein
VAHDLDAFDNFIDRMMEQFKIVNGTPQNLGEWSYSIEEERQGEKETSGS